MSLAAVLTLALAAVAFILAVIQQIRIENAEGRIQAVEEGMAMVVRALDKAGIEIPDDIGALFEDDGDEDDEEEHEPWQG